MDPRHINSLVELGLENLDLLLEAAGLFVELLPDLLDLGEFFDLRDQLFVQLLVVFLLNLLVLL